MIKTGNHVELLESSPSSVVAGKCTTKLLK